MAQSTAWVFRIDDACCAAVGELEMTHVATAPLGLHCVPQAPGHCRHIVVWEGKVIPVMDLCVWLEGTAPDRSRAVLGITSYQGAPGKGVQHGALLLSGLPERVSVYDEQACTLPEQPAGWRELAVSCFELDCEPVPVLDLPRIFSGALLHLNAHTLSASI